MEKFVLPPGFRFHPTDEELVSHYLRRKICGRKIDFEAIGEVDLYNYEPWDLPDKSFLRTRDLEWYFFIPRDRKYPNGSRTNRATEKGYWKSTGKDRFVSSGSRNLGTKKTLVYYNGRAPKGERTNWVMHEFRLNDAECQRINASENGFVLCRIYQKSGAGPKNGEQYGAPVEDEEFDKLPPLEIDGGASFEVGMYEPGPHSVSGHCNSSPTGAYRNEASSHEDNKVEVQFTNGGLQPRNLKFPDLLGNMESDGLQVENVTNPNGTGSNVLPAYGGQDILPQACLEEDDILQDLYKLLKTGEQWGSTYATNNVETGFYQCGAQPPSDGDYVELNDLISVSDCEDGIEAIKTNNKQTNGGLKEFSEESECSSLLQMQALSMFPNIPCDCSSPCRDLPAGHGIHEKQQNLAEMQSSVSTVTYDSQCQSFQGDLLEGLIATSGLYNEELGTACQTDSGEPDLEEVFELFARAKEDKSFNVESFAENIQREVLPSEDTSLISSHDGQYYDALLSFTDADMYGETISAAMDIANNFGAPQMTLAQASLSTQVGGVLEKLAVDRFDNTEHSKGVVKPHEFVSESVLLSQGEGIDLGEVKHPPSPLSLLWRSWLETLPTSPASAADFSPKAISPGGPIHVTATGVGVNAVSVTGTCVSDDTTSSCTKCSVAEVKNTGRFVKSLSVIRQRSKPSDKWRIGYYTSAIFGGLWAVFWLFIAGGAWKLFGGLYRTMVASEP